MMDEEILECQRDQTQFLPDGTVLEGTTTVGSPTEKSATDNYTYVLTPISDEERATLPVLGRIANLVDKMRTTPSWIHAARLNGWTVKA